MFKIISRIISLIILLIISFACYKMFVQKEELKVVNLFYKTNKNDMQSFEIDKDIMDIDIELRNTELIVEVGERLKIETNNKKINIRQKEDKIEITEKKDNVLTLIKGNILKLTVPENYPFDEVEIDAGAGKVNITYLLAEELELNLGAGKVDIKNVTTTDDTKINGGAGSINIKESLFKNLKLNLGVGTLKFASKVEGDSDIECGVGSSDIKLYGRKEDYKIKISTGVGEIIIDGQKVKESSTCGTGKNKIDISGGLGNLNIGFLD